jgi:hypothetical protein
MKSLHIYRKMKETAFTGCYKRGYTYQTPGKKLRRRVYEIFIYLFTPLVFLFEVQIYAGTHCMCYS